jgi:heat shock protein HtpX
MATLYTQKDKNIRKTWFLITAFLVFIIGLGYVFSYQFNSPAILIGAVIFSFFMSFLSYWHSDKVALAISGAREVKHNENPELYHILENLCITAGLPMPKLYIIEENAPNAFATGRNPEHAVVAVTRGLLEKLNRSELEGVLAHELSHIGNYDMLLSTAVVVLVGFIALASDWFLRWSFWGRKSSNDDRGQLGAIMMLAGIVLAILSPLVATLIQLAISRKREFLADASGALLTRYPDGLASALQKIAADQTPLRAATSATAHLYISNPFSAGRRSQKISSLFMTHPPIKERIKALRDLQV